MFTSTTIYEKPPEPSIPEIIIQYAEEYDVDPDIMLSIAWEESWFKNIPNSIYTENYYSAFGIFMIVNSTWLAYCGDNVEDRKIPEKNIECAMKIVTKSGTHHWSESEYMNSITGGWHTVSVTTDNYKTWCELYNVDSCENPA